MKNIWTKISAYLMASMFIADVPAQTLVEVFVNSRGTNAIKKYDENGQYLGNFITPGSGGLVNPEDILFHPDGSILVTGAGNTVIKRYNGQTGMYIGNFSTGYSLSIPSKMSLGWDSLIYVTQWGDTQNKVVRFDLQGHFVDEFTKIGAPKGLGHIWDADKNFYISLFGATFSSGTVHKFDSLGNSLGTFINTLQLQGPTDIWFDTDGTMLVEDWQVGKVLRYNANGQYVGVFATGLTNPEGMARLPNGNLLIGDWGVDAVHLLDGTGNVLGLFTSGNGLSDPNCVKVRISTTTSVESGPIKESGLGHVSVRPNPASNIVFIETDIDAFGVELFNRTGQLVLSEANVHTLNVSHLPTGVYLVKITDTATSRVAIEKLVVIGK